MDISLKNVGKQFNGEWIFKSISLSFSQKYSYHITGSNGSGKSTLLKVISGYSVPSQGEITWGGFDKNKEGVYEQVSLCSPFMELFENHTVFEAIEFHFRFKKLISSVSIDEVVAYCYLGGAEHKLVSELSSGMKQRLKLALCFLSDTPYLLLDEPCANLDDKAISWYQKNLKECKKKRLIIICSNNKEEEHFICNKTVNLGDYKNQ